MFKETPEGQTYLKKYKYTCEKCGKGCDVAYLKKGKQFCEECFFNETDK